MNHSWIEIPPEEEETRPSGSMLMHCERCSTTCFYFEADLVGDVEDGGCFTRVEDDCDVILVQRIMEI